MTTAVPRRGWTAAVPLLLALTLPAAATLPAPLPLAVEQLAVTVHPGVGADEISLDRLRRIFLGDQQYWQDGSKIVVLIHAPGTVQRQRTLRVLFRMSEVEYKQFWVARIFRSEVTSGPRIVPDAAAMVDLVSTIPGAIAVTLHPPQSADVKILRVDGKLPGESGYVFDR